MEQPTYKERIQRALLNLPAATTNQLSRLFPNTTRPLKRSSEHLVELFRDKKLSWEWHGREKIWRLTKKQRAQMNGSTKTYRSLHHALSIGDVYFALEPELWLYEPKEKFSDGLKDYVWAPDFVCACRGKLICGEVQLEPLTKKRWEAKWKAWNLFFEKEEYVRSAQYQAWHKKTKPIIPSTYVVITGQKEENVKTGFNHPHKRQLLVVKDSAQLVEYLNKQIAVK